SGGFASWPSQANDGTMAVVQGSDGAILRISKTGDLLNVMPSYATVDSTRWQTPERAQISPDGTKIAFDQLGPGGGYSTLWTPATSTSTDYPNQTIGQEDFGTPYWLG